MTARKKVAAYAYAHEAEFARDMLGSHGIKAFIATDDGGGNIPGQAFMNGNMVFVNDEDFERAREVLNQAQAADGQSQDWKCSQCGEIIENQFSQCWNCGNSK